MSDPPLTPYDPAQPVIRSASREFATRYLKIRVNAIQLLDDIDALMKIVSANPQFSAAVNAAESGAIIGDSGLEKETIQMAILLLTRNQTLNNQVIPDTTLTFGDAIRRLK